jgi:threonine/homoserine efflux transporter RhtA
MAIFVWTAGKHGPRFAQRRLDTLSLEPGVAGARRWAFLFQHVTLAALVDIALVLGASFRH